MKRPLVLAVALLLSTMALAFSSPSTARVKPLNPDKCGNCLRKVQRDLEKCEAQHGGPNIECDEGFNQGIIVCYATVCEQ